MKKTTAILTACLLYFSVAAQPDTDSIGRLLRAESDPSRRADYMLQLCEVYRSTNPDSCRFYSERAIAILGRKKDDIRLAKAELFLATYYYIMGKPDTALAMLQKNIPALQADPSQRSVLGQYYSSTGLCYMKMDQKKKALDLFYLALQTGEKINDNILQLKAYVNIGWAMMELNQFEQAIGNFNQAITLTNEKKLPELYSAVIYNNLASCYGSLEKTDSAFKYAQVAIRKAKAQHDIVAHANGLNILGMSQQKMGKLQDALQSLLEAQPLRLQVGDPFFIVSDQAELSSLYARLGKTSEGISTATQALEIAEKNRITAKLPMIYTALAANYEAAKDYTKATEVYKKINALKDSMYADANPRALAEMRARYETEQQERIIEQQRNKIARQNFLFLGIAGLVLMAGLLAYSYYHRFKLKKEAQLKTEILHHQELATRAVIEAEEEERQRIARDLHDGVGQMMSAAKMNLSAFESETNFTNDEQREAFHRIIRLVDDSCREVRHVSHNMMPNALLKNNLAMAIRDFIDKMDQKTLQVHLYSEGLDERLDSNIETVLYRVIQECVNNVIKHAGASTLDISVVKDLAGISATVEDNGRGFDTSDKEKFDGVGLKNILSRVEYLKGSVEFDSAPGKGTVVSVHVPISPGV